MTPLRPEIELLLTCARAHLQPTHADAFYTRLRDDLDWEEVLRLARQHRVLPLLYHQLKTIGPPALPAAVRNELRRDFQANLHRNLVLTSGLLKLLRLLEPHGIAALAYKGPALAAAAHGDLSLRQFIDLDILVHRQDVLNVKALLLSQGYQALLSLGPAQQSVYLQTGCELNFCHPTRHILVDLHWRLFQKCYGFPLPLEPLWERRQAFCLNGQTIQSLAPEDLLLILCIHNGKHHWDRLAWLCDVAKLLHRYPRLDWEALIDRSASARRACFGSDFTWCKISWALHYRIGSSNDCGRTPPFPR